ncbi:MAG TPA: hypothetical protein VJB90_03795 [Candidatus Nanoarchaeia archaeon]|nr:hypothetical protein [Candidatus Nanoarchaeia archaeon]
MDSKADMYLKRAKTELETAEILEKISENKDTKRSFDIAPDSTYYSGVISHAYYAIFYSAKAMLLTKKIETKAPEVHKKTLDTFGEVFIDSGLLDAKLLMIYKKMAIRAETLLEIFKTEKRKRGDFTYNTIPQANAEPADESRKNAKIFIKHCNTYLSDL